MSEFNSLNNSCESLEKLRTEFNRFQILEIREKR
jgi:hypothetical protein